MLRNHRSGVLIVVPLVALLAGPVGVSARGHGPYGHVSGGVVFVGGYFYNPFYGPYPWWGPDAYGYPYFPIYDTRARVRLLVTPKQAAVHVDGYYAGIVDDFDGFFQNLPLSPGGHEIVLYLEGYRTVRQTVYLTPDSTYKLHYAMQRLTQGEVSEPPPSAPPVPPPPTGSAMPPHTPRPGEGPIPPTLPTGEPPAPQSRPAPQARPVPPPPPPPSSRASSYGALVIQVQPPDAEVRIDGERWMSSGTADRLVVQVSAGAHRVEVQKEGYRQFSTEIQVGRGETTPLNVSLSREEPR